MDLHQTEYPQLAKQDVLFIHGNLASTVWWEPTAAAWKARGPQGRGALITADWRGCGKNPKWPIDKPFSLQELAEDFLALLRKRGTANVGVVGHSLGGLIALQMMILDPRLFSRAVLLDPVGAKGVVFDDSMYEAFRLMARDREMTKAVILGTVRNSDQLDSQFAERLTDDAFKAAQGIGASVLGILKTVNLVEATRTVKVPTLILHGHHDQVIPLSDSHHLASTMVNAQLQVLPNAGHCWNVENPGAFVDSLRNWF